MTEGEIIEIAAEKARQLNMPWGPRVTVKRLWRLWPSPRAWRVVSVVPSELSETTMIVSERRREAFPRRVRVARRFGEGR